MNVLRYRKLCLNQMDRCVMAVKIMVVLKVTHLKMEDKLLYIGWKMGSTRLEPVSLSVPPLPELTQWYTSCVSPANALVIVLALNSKCIGTDTKG